MTDLIIACVNAGPAHSIDRVGKLRNSVALNMKQPYTMVCLTDQPDRCSDVAFVDISALDLHGEMGKMALFEPAWRDQAKVVFIDATTAVLDDITPLIDVPGEFAILESRARLLSLRRYDSSVMVIGGGMCDFVWKKYQKWADRLVEKNDFNAVIEMLYPSALLLQRLLPKGFFIKSVVTRD